MSMTRYSGLSMTIDRIVGSSMNSSIGKITPEVYMRILLMTDMRFEMSGRWNPMRAVIRVIPKFIAMCIRKIGIIRNHVMLGRACGGIRMIATHIEIVVITAVNVACSTFEIGIEARGKENARIIALPARIAPVPEVIALEVERYMRMPITMNAGKFSTPRLAPMSTPKMSQ